MVRSWLVLGKPNTFDHCQLVVHTLWLYALDDRSHVCSPTRRKQTLGAVSKHNDSSSDVDLQGQMDWMQPHCWLPQPLKALIRLCLKAVFWSMLRLPQVLMIWEEFWRFSFMECVRNQDHWYIFLHCSNALIGCVLYRKRILLHADPL